MDRKGQENEIHSTWDLEASKLGPQGRGTRVQLASAVFRETACIKSLKWGHHTSLSTFQATVDTIHIFFNYFMIENCLELGQVPQQPGIKRMTGSIQCSTKVWLITKFPLQRHQPSLSVFGCGISSEGSSVRLTVSRMVTLGDNGNFKRWSASWSSYPWKHLCRSWRGHMRVSCSKKSKTEPIFLSGFLSSSAVSSSWVHISDDILKPETVYQR